MGRRRSHKRVSKTALSERTDEELLTHFLATGDETAFAALVERYERRVMGECMRVLHHRQDAEDALQNTFLVLMRRACYDRGRAEAQELADWSRSPTSSECPEEEEAARESRASLRGLRGLRG